MSANDIGIKRMLRTMPLSDDVVVDVGDARRLALPFSDTALTADSLVSAANWTVNQLTLWKEPVYGEPTRERMCVSVVIPAAPQDGFNEFYVNFSLVNVLSARPRFFLGDGAGLTAVTALSGEISASTSYHFYQGADRVYSVEWRKNNALAVT